MNTTIKTIDSEYLHFLREALPKLKQHRIPLWHRSYNSKHDSLRYILNKKLFDQNGIVAEFGVYTGTTIRMIAKKFPQMNIYGFDSFVGFPDDGRKDWQQDFSLQGQLPEVPSNVTLVKGYFEDTLNEFVEQYKNQFIALLHIDCDIYSSTKTIFDICRPLIKPGCIIVFDELLHYDGFEKNEILAFYEFLNSSQLDFEWLAIRNKVLDIDDYFNPPPSMAFDWGRMKNWRKNGYEQEVAVRIL